MVGAGPDPDHVVARTRERCAVALMGNHDYGATGSAEPTRFGEPGSPAARSIELARERLDEDAIAWMRTRRPAARRGDVQCWHGGPHNPVREYVGKANAAACLATQKGWLGLVGHTHAPAAFAPDAARSQVRPGPRRRAARPLRRQVAAQPGSRGSAAPAPPGLVGRARRRGRRRRLLAPARPRAPQRDVAARALRPGPRARAGAGARPRRLAHPGHGRLQLLAAGDDRTREGDRRPCSPRPCPSQPRGVLHRRVRPMARR